MIDSSAEGKTWKAVGRVLGDSLELAFLSSNTERAWGYLRRGEDLVLLKKETPEGVKFSEPLSVDQVVPAVEGWLDSVGAVSHEVIFGALEVEGVPPQFVITRVVPVPDLVDEGVFEVS